MKHFKDEMDREGTVLRKGASNSAKMKRWTERAQF